MSILDQIRQRAASNLQHIVLPEGEDPRTVVAAGQAVRQRLARITVLGDEEKVRAAARDTGSDLGGVELIDHIRANDFDKMVSLLYEARRAKGLTLDEARNALRDPLYYGNLMVRAGRADGSVAGATNTTSHTVRAALHCIGVRPGFKLVSSFFLMALRDQSIGHNGAMIYADCGVVIEPSAAELAEIAIASADSCRALLESGRHRRCNRDYRRAGAGPQSALNIARVVNQRATPTYSRQHPTGVRFLTKKDGANRLRPVFLILLLVSLSAINARAQRGS